MSIELKQAAQDATEAIDWLLKNIRLDAPQLAGKAMGNAEKCASALRAAIQQAGADAQQPATAIACGIPGMAKTTCPYCEQGFAFEHEQPATGEPFGYIHHFAAHDESGALIDTTWEADGCSDPLPHPTFPSMWKWTHCTPFYTTQQPATPEPVQADSSEHLRVIANLGAALRRLSFAAQTTGGTDGPDAELQSAIGQAEQALSLGDIWQAMSATGELEPYDAGLLNDFGGGNVEWWQDYIRAELGHAHAFYQSQVAKMTELSGREESLRTQVDLLTAAVEARGREIAKLKATGEPAAWSEREQLRHAQATVVMPMIGPLLDAWGNSDREVMSQAPELSKQLKNINSAMEDADTHPAPSVLKDDQIAALVNKVRDIARMFHDHQSLRERIAIELVPALKASQEVKSNAERWCHAIADGENQSMNFIDIFSGWDGDGDFVEVFDAAMLATKDASA